MGKNYRYEKVPYKESFAYYIEVKLEIDLDLIWNWEKNNELGINPYEIAKQSNKKVWLYCLEHDYHNYDRNGNKVGYEITCNNFYNNKRCGYCHRGRGSSKIHYKDSVAYNYPQIAKMIAIEENGLTFEDCYNIACQSNKRFYFKCLDCNIISNKKYSLSQITIYGYSCHYCGDGISIPNKFMSNLLNQLNINFKSEYSPYYFRNSQHVDFLLIDYNIIIEMDGNYGNHTKEYDYWRDFLNMKYGGYKTIRIKLFDNNKYSNDTLNYIKEQIIKSELSNIFDFNKINWILIWEKCQKSEIIKTWELWNNGIHDIDILSKITNTSKSTVCRRLKKGAECNMCNYTKNESIKVGSTKIKGEKNYKATKVMCVTTGKKFNTLTEASKFYNVCISGITLCCKGKYKSAGSLNGKRLIWKYIKEEE